MEKQKSNHLINDAVTTVIEALKSLSEEERIRVLRAASALYGVSFKKNINEIEEIETVSEKNNSSTEKSSTKKKKSIAEYVKSKSPATNSQRIATFACFREKYEGKTTFSPKDLEEYFSSAKLSKPGYFMRDFNSAVKEGWIHEEGENSYLTSTGEGAVEAGFGGKGKPRGAAIRKKKRFAKN